jgi:hypothetical protein
MQTKKGIQYFKVKWSNIPEGGCTWEPASHFIGDSAKTVLATFRQERAQQETQKGSRFSGKRPMCNSDADIDVQIVDGSGTCPETPSNKLTGNLLAYHRRKSSDVWRFFGPKYFDKEDNCYYARCKICEMPVKVLNTTNLKSHLNSRHGKEMVQFKDDNKVRGEYMVPCGMA